MQKLQDYQILIDLFSIANQREIPSFETGV